MAFKARFFLRLYEIALPFTTHWQRGGEVVKLAQFYEICSAYHW